MTLLATYSRVGYAALVKESVAGVALKPTQFIPIISEDIVPKYDVSTSSPVAANPVINLRGVPDAIKEPTGKIEINLEPETAGWFLEGAYGTPTDGRYMPTFRRLFAGTVTGTAQLGATLAQATSLATGTVQAIASGQASFDLYGITGAFDASHTVTGTNPDTTTFTFTPTAILNGTAFQVGETVTGGSSSATAVVSAVSTEGDYLLTGSFTGTFTAGETITGGTSSAVATIGITANTVYGHQFTQPTTTLPTYTIEFGYLNNAVRLFGVVINDFMANQKNNIVMGQATITAKAAFSEARITAITASGGGTKVLTVDQTSGLVVGDVMKIYRPSTGQFIDFNGSGVKINTVTAIGSENTISFSVLTTATAVGDLLLLAPQTTTYTDQQPFTWVGGSTSKIADLSLQVAMAQLPGFVEDFEIGTNRGIEARHAANGANIINRFPSAIYQKGIKGNGKLHQIFTDMSFLDRLRTNRYCAMQLFHTGTPIAATGINYLLDWRIPEFLFKAFGPVIKEDAMLDQEMPIELFDSATAGYFIKALLVNDVASY